VPTVPTRLVRFEEVSLGFDPIGKIRTTGPEPPRHVPCSQTDDPGADAWVAMTQTSAIGVFCHGDRPTIADMPGHAGNAGQDLRPPTRPLSACHAHA
jgi:hypothetical protein